MRRGCAAKRNFAWRVLSLSDLFRKTTKRDRTNNISLLPLAERKSCLDRRPTFTLSKQRKARQEEGYKKIVLRGDAGDIMSPLPPSAHRSLADTLPFPGHNVCQDNFPRRVFATRDPLWWPTPLRRIETTLPDQRPIQFPQFRGHQAEAIDLIRSTRSPWRSNLSQLEATCPQSRSKPLPPRRPLSR